MSVAECQDNDIQGQEEVPLTPRVPQSRRPMSLVKKADTVSAAHSGTYEDALLQLLHKHQSDLEALFYKFHSAVESNVVLHFDHDLKSDQPAVVNDQVNESCLSDILIEYSGRANLSEAVEVDVCPSEELTTMKHSPTSHSISSRRSRVSRVSKFVASWQATQKTPLKAFQFAVWNFLEQPDGGVSNQIFHHVTNLLIAVSVASPVVATAHIPEDIKSMLSDIDIVFTALFTIELLTKLICYPDRLAFLKSMYSLIDVAVVIAGFLGIAFAGTDNIWLDLINTQVPILRLLKITRHSSGWRLLMMSMKNCVSPLLVPLYLMLLMIVFTGSLHFWIDNVLACTSEDCPEADKPAFQSIPHAMWFVLVSLSTVGYGDITPHTDVGKILACFQIVMGLCYMAMPLAIIGNNFSEIWNDRHRLLLSDKLTHGAIKRDIWEVKKLFNTFDHDKSGAIGLDEFLVFVDSLEMGLSKRVIRDLFRSIDADASGIISFTEFAEFVFPDAWHEVPTEEKQ